MSVKTSLQSPELATSFDATKKTAHYDDVVVGTKFLKTTRGDKLHCRYWRRKSGTEDEGDLKVRNSPTAGDNCDHRSFTKIKLLNKYYSSVTEF